MHNCSLQILRPMRDQISDHGYNTSYFQLTGASYIYYLAGGGFVGGRSHGFFFLGGGGIRRQQSIRGRLYKFCSFNYQSGGEREGSSDPLGEE